MSENHLVRMESESEEDAMSWSCPEHQTRGGLKLQKTNYGPIAAVAETLEQLYDGDGFSIVDFECICGTEAIIPLPVASAAKFFLKGFVKVKGVRRILKWIKTMPRWAKRKWYRAARVRLAAKLRAAGETVQQTADAYMRAPPGGKSVRDKLIEANRAIREKFARFSWTKDRLKTIRDKIKNLKNSFKESGCVLGATWEDFLNTNTVIFTPQGSTDAKFRWCVMIAELVKRETDQAAFTLSQVGELEDAIRQMNRSTESLRATKDAYEKALEARDRLAEELATLDATAGDVTDQQIDEMLGPITGESALETSSLAAAVFDGLMVVLQYFSIVQEKNCLYNRETDPTGPLALPVGLQGADLDPETCKCTKCTRYPQLCNMETTIANLFPSLLGTRQSDELNTCMQCCDAADPEPRVLLDGSVGVEFGGSFVTEMIMDVLGAYPCSCECLERGGVTRNWVDCDKPVPQTCERGYLASRTMVCKTDEVFVPNNLEWSAETCAYECKTHKCGTECCDVGKEYCDSYGRCSSCPPGYKTVSTYPFMAQDATEQCLPDCSDTAHPDNACLPGYCCTENLFLKDTGGGPTFDCISCDKIKSFRFDNVPLPDTADYWFAARIGERP